VAPVQDTTERGPGKLFDLLSLSHPGNGLYRPKWGAKPNISILLLLIVLAFVKGWLIILIFDVCGVGPRAQRSSLE